MRFSPEKTEFYLCDFPGTRSREETSQERAGWVFGCQKELSAAGFSHGPAISALSPSPSAISEPARAVSDQDLQGCLENWSSSLLEFHRDSDNT
jgi:hypothetical protein